MNMHEDLVRINHMLDAAKKALVFTKRKTPQDLNFDEKLSLALVRLIEIFGEAANALSTEFKEKHPEVPWR